MWCGVVEDALYNAATGSSWCCSRALLLSCGLAWFLFLRKNYLPLAGIYYEC